MTIALLLFLIFLLVVLVASTLIGVCTNEDGGEGFGVGFGIGLFLCMILTIIFRWGSTDGIQRSEGRVLRLSTPADANPHPPAAEGGSR